MYLSVCVYTSSITRTVVVKSDLWESAYGTKDVADIKSIFRIPSFTFSSVLRTCLYLWSYVNIRIRSPDRPVFLLPGAVRLGGSSFHPVRASQWEGTRRGGAHSVEKDKLVPGWLK